MRVALYARFSDKEKQRDTSIVDQLRVARDRAEREGWRIVAEHKDEGISGSTPLALRRGGKALVADSLAGRFDVLLVEGLDRLNRDMDDCGQFVKRLEHRGIRIIGTADGYDSAAGKGRKVLRVIKGLQNEMFLDDLREKTHRGLAGQFDRGLSAGGRAYGYTPVEAPGGRALQVDAGQAAVVRDIFEAYADGDSVRAIAHRLNDKGIPSPRGGTWAVSALQGSAAKGLGLLHNEMYIGRMWWNRRQWIKDPDTGKRNYVERPRAEWQLREAPELRIVSDELWQRALARQGTRGTRTGKGAIPKTLFGGLLRCCVCNGAIVAVDARRYGCSVAKDRGPAACDSEAVFGRELVDQRLLLVVREELLAPTRQVKLQAAVKRSLANHFKESSAGSDTSRRRLAALGSEISRLVDAVAAIGLSDALQARLRAAEVEKAKLELELTPRGVSPDRAVVDGVMARYKRMLLQLQSALADQSDRDRTRQVLAKALGRIQLGEENGKKFADFDDEPAARMLLEASGGVLLGVVAGARNSSRKRIWLD